MQRRLDIAISRPVVFRALRYALIVGVLLAAINHGDAILRGDLTLTRLLRMLLTALVPYAVSTLSSVEAALDRDPAAPLRHDPAPVPRDQEPIP